MEKFSKEELEELTNVVKKITTHIPKDRMSLIWNSYKKISGDKSPQPCSCPSSGNLWRNAMNVVSEYVKGK